MGGPRPRGDRWLAPVKAAAAVIALLSGGLCYRSATHANGFESLPDPTRRELAALTMPRDATREIERKWAARLDDSGYLLAPVGPSPCGTLIDPTGDRAARLTRLRDLVDQKPDDLLVTLVYGTELIHAGEYSAAARILRDTLNNTTEDTRLIGLARNASLPLTLSDAHVSTIIYLQHAHVVAELNQPGAAAPWDSLKNAIGLVKAISDRRPMRIAKGDPTWSPLPIRAPGCSESQDSLSSHDLYNNLIVAYMTAGFVPSGTPEQQQAARDKEFAREPQAKAGAVRQLFLQQLGRTMRNGWKDESKLWALSNVERILGWGYPDDARLNVNIIRVLDEAAQGCDGEWCAELYAVKDVLLEQALLRYEDIPPDQRPAFGRNVIRMLAASNVDLARVAPATTTIRGWVSQADALVLGRLMKAEEERRLLPRWIVGLAEDEITPSAWREAAEIDFVSAASGWAADKPEEQERIITASRQLLAGREAPAALTALEKGRGTFAGIWLRMQASPWFWAFAAAAFALLVWYVLLWVIVAVRDWRHLHTSFYNVELDHLRASAPPPGRKGAR